MDTLKIENNNGSTYTFYVENYRIFVEAKTSKGQIVDFTLENNVQIKDGMLETSKGKLPIRNDADLIQNFINEAKVRTLFSFRTHEEMMKAVRENYNSGECFEQDNRHCFYVYNK